MVSNLLPLMGIITIAWILVFIGAYIIFDIIVVLPDFFPGREGQIFTSIVKATLATFLIMIWLLIMVKLTNRYVRKKILR